MHVTHRHQRRLQSERSPEGLCACFGVAGARKGQGAAQNVEKVRAGFARTFLDVKMAFKRKELKVPEGSGRLWKRKLLIL